MSTEDDKLLNLSEDEQKEISEILSEDEQKSPPKSDTISPEKVQEEEGEIEEQGDSLSPEVQVIIDKYSSLTEVERELKLEKLESSGRSEQLKAAEIIREAFEIPKEKEEEKEKTYSPEEQRLIEKGKSKEREEYINDWAKTNNKKVDASKALTNDKFLKHYYGKELQNVPLKERTELALFRTFGVKTISKKSDTDIDIPQGSGSARASSDFDPFKMDPNTSIEDFLKK